jgi:hypothetical protein
LWQTLLSANMKWEMQKQSEKFYYCNNYNCSRYWHALTKCPEGHSGRILMTRYSFKDLRLTCIKCGRIGVIIDESTN